MAELIDSDSPFHPNNAAGLQLIMQMRIYDALLSILNHVDENTADAVYEAHQNGQIVSGLPFFNVPDTGTTDTALDTEEQ